MRIILFILLFVNWMIFSGFFDPFHLGLGVVACFFVSYSTRALLLRHEHEFVDFSIIEALRFPGYIIWLIKEIILANFHILKLVFHPRLKSQVQPKIIDLDVSNLKNDFARVVLAHSITLTPGTVTMFLDHSSLKVYAINPQFATGLKQMLDKVNLVFKTDQ